MSDSNYIDGIFNYCDRWCERCPFTARCRTFAMEQEFERAEQEGRDPEDIDWDAFWKRVGLSFDETPPHWLGEFDDADDEPALDLGITFRESTDELEDRLDAKTDSHPLVRRAHEYAAATHRWLREHTTRSDRDGSELSIRSADVHARGRNEDENAVDVSDALAVIAWYHTLIAAKSARAVSGLIESDTEAWRESVPPSEVEEDDFDELMRQAGMFDAAGSGKVALMSIERSIGAWTAIRTRHPELTDSIAPLQRLLGGLRVAIDQLLPAARTFHRPGFDD